MIKQLIVSLFSGFLGVLFTIYYNSNSTIEYKDSVQEKYLNISHKAFKDLKLLYNDKKIDSISIYQVQLYNKTWKEYDNVTLYFSLSSDNKVPNIINKDFFVPSNQAPNIGVSKFEKVKDNIYKVKIKVFKQTGRNNYYLARIVFEGKEIPKINISVPENKGLEISEYTYIQEWAMLIGSFILFIVLIVVIIAIVAGFDNNRIWRKRLSRFEEILSKTESLKEKEKKQLIESYTNEFKFKDNYFYKKTLELLTFLGFKKK